MKPKLHLPRPCDEQLSNMTPVEGGLHCDRCNHDVIDFRTWNEHDMLAYLRAKRAEKTCGIFLPEQASAGRPGWFGWRRAFRAAAVAGRALFAAPVQVKAQVGVINLAAVSGAANDSTVWKISGQAYVPVKHGGATLRSNARNFTVRIYDDKDHLVAETHADNGTFSLIFATAVRDARYTIVFSGDRYREHRIRNFNPDEQGTLDVKLKLRRGAQQPKVYRTVGCPSF